MSALVLDRCSVAPGVEARLVAVDGVLRDAVPPGDAQLIDVAGRPVLPGLADQHVHLLALAASWESVDCSPEGGALADALRTARARQPDGWLRGVGYDVATSGPIDRTVLDGIGAGPLRVQDRTGILWVLDSAALDAVLPADPADWPDGVERDAGGRPTGRLFRLDRWLRERWPTKPPDVAAVGRWLASRGVTSLTDAGAQNGADEVALLTHAGLPQRLTVMTATPDVASNGPVKILLDEAALPDFDELAQRIAGAHRAGRAVAVHCVDAASLTLALAAGVGAGDRVEHASVVPQQTIPLLAASGATVVTNPGLIATRGDRYLTEVDPADRDSLYRLRSLRDAGIPLAAGSDAPYGPADPWVHVAAAVNRRTASGSVVGVDEHLGPLEAVRLWAGGELAPGQPADLVVLDTGWDAIAAGQVDVAMTIIGGHMLRP